MVLQDYGAALPPPEPAAMAAGRPMRFRTVSVVAIVAVAMALLVMATFSGSAGKSELVQERLSGSLMSQFSSANSDSSSDDDTSQLSSSGSTGWYGHWSDGASSSASQPNWQKELQKREAAAAARRARENRRFFSGVDKAFGKKAAEGMLDAFNGKGKNVLTKFKLNEKKLAEQKKKIAENTVVPSSDHKHSSHPKGDSKAGDEAKKAEANKGHDTGKKVDAVDTKKDDASKKAEAKKAAALKTEQRLASKKIDHAAEEKKAMKQAALKVAKKMAEHKDPSADSKASADAKAKAKDLAKKAKDNAKEEASVVKDALKIAKSMSEHKDPVFKAPKKAVHHEDDDKSKSEAKVAKKVEKPTVHSLQHQGLMQTTKALKETVHEFKTAHGAEKKKLKARVMELQQQITDDTKAVTHFGARAKTAFKRAEAKEKAQKGGKSHSKASAHESRSDMSDAQRLKADGWD